MSIKKRIVYDDGDDFAIVECQSIYDNEWVFNDMINLDEIPQRVVADEINNFLIDGSEDIERTIRELMQVEKVSLSEDVTLLS